MAIAQNRADGAGGIRAAGFRGDESGGGGFHQIDCARDLPEISLPLRPVEQAVGILVDNAVEASPEGISRFGFRFFRGMGILCLR